MNAVISGPEHIGIRLRSARREKGLTQDQLAKEAGTNQAVIQKIENGKSLRPRQIIMSRYLTNARNLPIPPRQLPRHKQQVLRLSRRHAGPAKDQERILTKWSLP